MAIYNTNKLISNLLSQAEWSPFATKPASHSQSRVEPHTEFGIEQMVESTEQSAPRVPENDKIYSDRFVETRLKDKFDFTSFFSICISKLILKRYRFVDSLQGGEFVRKLTSSLG